MSNYSDLSVAHKSGLTFLNQWYTMIYHYIMPPFNVICLYLSLDVNIHLVHHCGFHSYSKEPYEFLQCTQVSCPREKGRDERNHFNLFTQIFSFPFNLKDFFFLVMVVMMIMMTMIQRFKWLGSQIWAGIVILFWLLILEKLQSAYFLGINTWEQHNSVIWMLLCCLKHSVTFKCYICLRKFNRVRHFLPG